MGEVKRMFSAEFKAKVTRKMSLDGQTLKELASIMLPIIQATD